MTASHSINLGKSLIDPGSFILIKEARKLLATNYDEFIATYGSHYIIGADLGCKVDIIFKKKVREDESK